MSSDSSALASALPSNLVRDYLAEHPDFLARNADLLARLIPPSRHGEAQGVEDFQLYMLSRLQNHLNAMNSEHDDLMELMQEHMQLQSGINQAILAAMDVTSFAETVQCVTETWPGLLDHASVGLFFEAGESFPEGYYGAARVVKAGFITDLMGADENSLLTDDTARAAEVFGEAAPRIGSYALVRLKIDDATPIGMIALGHSDPLTYATRLPTEQVELLGAVLSRVLHRWLHD